MSQTIYDIPVKSIDGAALTLEPFKGKVLLIVNVASKCGLTPQYEALEKLYKDRRAEGLEVLGFPANNFKGQEPGTDGEIMEFCSSTYDVKFPMFSKVSVIGADQHPLYQTLTSTQPATTGDGPFRERLKSYGIEPNPAPDVLCNFEKFVIGWDGRVVGRFSPDVTADDLRLLEAIQTALSNRARSAVSPWRDDE